MDPEQFLYDDRVKNDRNDYIDQLMEAANIEGVEFDTLFRVAE